jgi:hypothetical protein
MMAKAQTFCSPFSSCTPSNGSVSLRWLNTTIEDFKRRRKKKMERRIHELEIWTSPEP